MNFLIMGLPGSGKGTQAEKICAKYNLGHLSTGDMFRTVMKSDSELSKELASFINKGMLVPDELTIRMLTEELKNSKYSTGFLLDGFPRTIVQAQALDKMLEEENKKLNAVISLDLDEDIIIERLVNRLVCSKCGHTFHKIFVKPKKDNICDICDGDLIQRDDDKLEQIIKRMSVAKEQTLPVVDHYEVIGNVKTIHMTKEDSTGDVFCKIEKELYDFD